MPLIVVANCLPHWNSLPLNTSMISGFNNSMVQRINSLPFWGNSTPKMSDGRAPWVHRMAKRLRSNSSNSLYFSFGHDVYPSFFELIQVTILPVLTALGLFPKSAYKPLGTDAIEWSRS